MSNILLIYTDGACEGNPGPGGWAVVMPDGKHESRGYRHTTNNRMELMAIIRAMELAAGQKAIIHSDSQYVVNGCNQWLAGWVKSGWKNGTVKNIDLWQKIRELKNDLFEIRWVRGHNGHAGNEKADRLAVAAIRGSLIVDEGYENL